MLAGRRNAAGTMHAYARHICCSYSTPLMGEQWAAVTGRPLHTDQMGTGRLGWGVAMITVSRYTPPGTEIVVYVDIYIYVYALYVFYASWAGSGWQWQAHHAIQTTGTERVGLGSVINRSRNIHMRARYGIRQCVRGK